MVKNFRFEEPGIALSGAPGTAEEVDWLCEQGVRTVVSLHPVPEDVQQRLRERGVRWEPVLVSDWSDGVPARLGSVLEAIGRWAEAEPSVLIH